MGQFIRQTTKVAYQKAIKPYLFKKKPDAVHQNMVSRTKIVQRMPLVRELPKLWAYKNDARLAQELFGLTFKNPLGLSAGLDKDAEIVSMVKTIGFGFSTVGSLTLHQSSGNNKPWFHRLPNSRSLVVWAGLPNDGVRLIAARIEKYSLKIFDDFPLVVSVAKTNSKETVCDQAAVDDYVGSLAILEKTKNIAMYELNISCPNVFGGEPFNTPERLNDLLLAVDGLKLKRPLTIKMPIDLEWKYFSRLLDVILKHNVQAVTIGNLFKNREKLTLKDPLPAKIKGNLSGAPCRETSTELIAKTYKKCGDKLRIIGVGGVFSARDAYAKIQAGASLVDLITGMIFEGPQLIGEINHDLAKLLESDGFKNVSEAVGVGVKK